MNGRIPIKDLVALFESVESISSSSSGEVQKQESQKYSQNSAPSPSPARFVKHPLLKKKVSDPDPPLIPVRKRTAVLSATHPDRQQSLVKLTKKQDSLPVVSSPILTSSSLGKRRIDVVDPGGLSISASASNNDRRKPPTQQARLTTRRQSSNTTQKSRDIPVSPIPLVPIPSSSSIKAEGSDSSKPPYHVSSEWRLITRSSQTTPTETKLSNNYPFKEEHNDYDFDAKLISTSAPDNHTELVQQHTPIAAKTIFARGAAPLSLPALDDYLSKAPQPNFTTFLTPKPPRYKGKAPQSDLFPPLDLFQASKKTFDDLEKNGTVPPWFRNRDNIFSSLLSVFLGILVCVFDIRNSTVF